MSPRLWRFHGGLVLPGHKAESTRGPVRAAPVPPRLILPLQQHIGAPAEPLVRAGEHVLKGQVVARAADYVSAPVHASSSGTVVEIAEHPVPHPSGLRAPCIVIETDGRDAWCTRDSALPDYARLDDAGLRARIRAAGIVGLGGAAFPSAVKLNPGRRSVDTVILNGAECEPYITCDDLLLRERPREVIEGLKILHHLLRPRACVIGVEDNKPEACAALRAALSVEEARLIRVVEVPTRYPAGGEKQLIRTLTGREVPSHGLPAEVGVVCHNVATAAAIYRAIVRGEPLISRIVTVTGRGVADPCNLEARIGTPVAELVSACGGYSDELERLVLGGSMMGFSPSGDQVPVVKGTNCVLAAGRGELAAPQPARPCIRCGECAQVCPARLLPQQLHWYARARDFDKAQDHHLFDCIECGCCAAVCPSHLPLVQYFRYAKTEIWAQERERRKAEAARRRHEVHVQRVTQEKAERAARQRRRKGAPRATPAGETAQDKQAVIQAALERVRAKRAAVAAEETDPREGAPAAGGPGSGR